MRVGNVSTAASFLLLTTVLVSRAHEWFELGNKYKMLRIAEGKYFKLLYSLHEMDGTLSASNVSMLCPNCDLGSKCPEKERLTVYCPKGVWRGQNKLTMLAHI